VIAARFFGQLGEFRLDAGFSAPARGITGLFGASGSGKTTVLRCIAGLTRVSGSLTIGEAVWQGERTFLPPHRRGAALVFQDPDLFPHLNVRANLEFGLRRAGAAGVARFDDVVGLLGLEPLLGRSTARLSGGERQRVAIGRALLSQPRLLLLDEPLSGLDATAKSEILPYLERLHAQIAIPIILVSHDLADIARLADHLVVMKAGSVIANGPCGLGEASAPATQDIQNLLADQSADVVTGLALAALMAGLNPVGSAALRPSTRPLARPAQDDEGVRAPRSRHAE
jgi:molybdate transport system ATP-binding protein